MSKRAAKAAKKPRKPVLAKGSFRVPGRLAKNQARITVDFLVEFPNLDSVPEFDDRPDVGRAGLLVVQQFLSDKAYRIRGKARKIRAHVLPDSRFRIAIGH